MKILYINGFVPNKNAPMAGIFVTKRIQALRKKNITICPYNYGVRYSKPVQQYLSKIRHSEVQAEPVKKQQDVEYCVRMEKMGFLEMATAGVFSGYYERKLARLVQKDIRKEKDIDIVHLHWLWPMGAGVMRSCCKAGIPYVITCHGSDINVTMENPRIRKEMIRILERAASVEFISKALLSKAKSLGYSGKNAVVIYNGIDGDIFGNGVLKEERKSIVIFAGNLIQIKGADRLPEIFQRVYSEYGQAVEFWVIGDGMLRKELERRMKDLPVVFTGQITQGQIAQEFNSASVLVLPSRNEGYPCVIKEAQACGVIPVGCDVGGISEAVGEYGTVVRGAEKGLLQELADVIVDYLKQKRQTDRKKMVEKAREDTWEHMQEYSIENYRKILGERKRIGNRSSI